MIGPRPKPARIGVPKSASRPRVRAPLTDLTPYPDASYFRERQNTLVTFLWTELDLAQTFLRSVGVSHVPDHQHAALSRARTALTTVKRLAARVSDPLACRELTDRARELEEQVAALSEEL
jgi:hypothetical protein